MRVVNVENLIRNVKEMCIEANHFLTDDMNQALKRAADAEKSPLGKKILCQLQDNLDIAAKDQIPICQDTGMAVLFVEIGQDVHVEGGLITDAVNEGVRQGYREGYLRKSVVGDPIIRNNTGDNTPAVLYTDIVPGNRVKVSVAPKGFGSENMSRIAMLKPAQGQQGVEDFIFETAKLAGPNPCPPMVLGVGIGGTFERCALLAKKALLRSVDSSNSDPFYGKMEQRLLERINELGTGPAGYGGKTTALAVLIEKAA